MPRKPGPPRKPTKLKKLAGNPGHRPLDEDEPEYPEDDPKKVAGWLGTVAMEEWERVAPICKAQGLLTIADRRALEMYCKAFARWRQAEALLDRAPAMVTKTKSGYLAPVPWVAIAQKYMDLTLKLGAEFGFSPAARARVKTGDGGGKDPDEDFFNRPPSKPQKKPQADQPRPETEH